MAEWKFKYCMCCTDLGCIRQNIKCPINWTDKQLADELKHEMQYDSVDVICDAHPNDDQVDIIIDEEGCEFG